MNTIKRAIIMAAGSGTRLLPLTRTIPKPLIQVNGVRMIDSVINALSSNGISEIHIVVGYMKEAFLSLSSEHPGVDLIENPYFQTCNNISSLYAARDFIADTFILDADQLIFNPAILSPHFTRSGYSCSYTTEHTDEWLLSVDESNTVKKCSRTGGKNGWQLFSVSRWTESDGRQLKCDLERLFAQPENWSLYWDDIALFCNPNAYELTVYPIEKTDLVEIDSLEELCAIDPAYCKFRGC